MPRKLLIVSQVFVPDPAAVGQYMTDAAAAMARRGHRVKVWASARGYEDPSRRYPAAEHRDGYEIRRIDFASFGKKSILARILGTASFTAQVFFRCLTERDLGAIFFSTSPPLVGFVAAIVGLLRGVPVAYWAMDLNPDQLIALGKLKPTSPAARLLEAVNRFIIRRSRLIIALDRFMGERLEARMMLGERLLVLPPWPQEDYFGSDTTTDTAPVETNPFRIQHGLTGKFVVMYSGNHSPSNPLDTVLNAAVRLKNDDRICFAFVGGGLGKRDVEACIAEHRLTNVISLPYQPIENLRHSLGAANVHIVSLGDAMVGIIHPCKIYGAMAIGRPVLYIGPRPSHVTDLIDANDFGRAVTHGDVDGCVNAINALRDLPQDTLRQMGLVARQTLARSLSQQLLTGQFCDRLEHALRLRR